MDTTSKRVLYAIIIVVAIAILALTYLFSVVIQSADRRSQEVATTDEKGQIETVRQESAGPVQIFYIVPGVESVTGDIGCGDGVKSVIVNTDRDDVIRFALENLFNIKNQQTEDGYHNALWQSELDVRSIDIEEKRVAIYLEGDLVLSGACAGPRALAQIEQTAKVAAEQQLKDKPSELEIFVNGQTLHETAGLR